MSQPSSRTRSLTEGPIARTLLLFFLLGVVFGVSMANTILVGQAMGAKDIDQAKRVIGTSVGFFVVLSTAAAVLGYVFTPDILDALGTPAMDVVPMAPTAAGAGD